VDKGTLVEFWHNNERRLAVLDRPEGKKNWVVIDGNGQSHTLHPRQFTYEVTGKTYKVAEIKAFLAEVTPYLDQSALEVAWELLTEMGENATLPAIASILFSDTSTELCYATHYLLSEDKIFFKKKAETYEPRSASQVAEIKHQLAVQAQKLKEQRGFWDRVGRALAGESVEWEDSDRQRLEQIERYAINPDNPVKLAQDTLSELGRPQTSPASFELLVDLGWWSPHENLSLRRSQIPVQFPPKVVEVAQKLIESSDAGLILQESRLDLSHLKVYTIDDESTQEIDDGLSVETLPDGRQRLWIHIADPTRLLSPGDELDLEARRRTTTLYLPTGMIPMFPVQLATGPMSLVQGRICYALSFGVLLDEAGAVSEYIIHPTAIKPTYRLTYEDVDEMLELGVEAEPEIEVIYRLAKLRHQWRQSQGSISIHMPEASIKVRDDEITIDVLADSHARELVAEMMILAGEVGARYAQTHQIPLPFRSQPQPELPSEEELLLIPPGPPRACAVRRCMPRSEMGITPSRHSGLGLEMYIQVTSPIRRYSDLLAHFQIKAHLQGEDLPFSPEKIQEIMQSVSAAAYEATLVERQTNRYWGLEYLRRHSDRPWQAMVLRWLREDEDLALVLIEDLGLELAMRFHRSVVPGEEVTIRVSHADPRQDVIHLREMVTEPSSTVS
jgi:exoribonuclease-2